MSDQPIVFPSVAASAPSAATAPSPSYASDSAGGLHARRADGAVTPFAEETAPNVPQGGWFRDVQGRLRRVDSDG